MAIGVFRIYLGCTWPDAAVERLVRGFDAIPGFLYRIDRPLPGPSSPEEEPSSPEPRRALIRIAMTQAHALLLLDTGKPLPADAAIEIDLAKRGFRRRLPVIAVTTTGADAGLTPEGCDARVSWDASAIACALQQGIEQSVADWRTQARSRMAETPSPSVPAGAVPHAPATCRTAAPQAALPVAEITAAYANLLACRGDPKPTR